jgi:formate hydrogenlyase transcriptional activator
MLRRITRSMATTEDLHQVLGSIVNALVEQPGMVTSRVWLYLHDHECDTCRSGPPNGAPPSHGKRMLHLHASAGDVLRGLDRQHHILPLDLPTPPALVVVQRRSLRHDDILEDPAVRGTPPLFQLLQSINAKGAAAYPLIFQGEVLGSIGMIADRRLEDEEYELLGIFADQAAMAIKSAQLFRDLARYRDRLERENAYLQEEIQQERGFEGIIGQSPALRAVLRKVQQVARVETTVLLTGETGTGKELIARALHEGSPRAERPLIKVNCGAIPQGVVESELFGHEKGAFTGALTRRIGRFELAHNGTLFMDEVGELPLDTQVKLLRVLQEQEFERVGATRPQKVDVRLVAATNRDLEKEVAENRFRADLYYRLNVFPIRIPPLRERPSDIPLLVKHFLAQFQRKLAKPLKAVTVESMERMEHYAWPGNVRELQNVLERACVLAEGPVVEVAENLSSKGRAEPSDVGSAEILPLEENERIHIRRALAAARGKVHGPEGAAALLRINPSTLRSRMQKLGIGRQTV